MANTLPSIFDDPSAFEVLHASNIADDDMLWIVRCQPSEIARFVLRPRQWVAALGDLPGWIDAKTGRRAAAPSLTRDFTVTIGLAHTPDAEGRIVVQGISGTNVINVVVSPTGASFDALWADFASDPAASGGRRALPISVVPSIGTLFGHAELMTPGESPEERASRVAQFALGVVLDPAGYTKTLSGLTQSVATVQGPVSSTSPTSSESLGNANERGEALAASPGTGPVVFGSMHPRVTLANAEEDDAADNDENNNYCHVLTAPYDGTTNPTGPGDTTIKRWRAADPTPD